MSATTAIGVEQPEHELNGKDVVDAGEVTPGKKSAPKSLTGTLVSRLTKEGEEALNKGGLVGPCAI